MATVVLVARRVLAGRSRRFGEFPADLPFRDRASLLLSVTASEALLLGPLLGLAALVFLARPSAPRPPSRAALWCGSAVAVAAALLAAAQVAVVGYLTFDEQPAPGEVGFYGGREPLLDLFGARTAATLLVGALAAGLAVLLARTARAPEPAEEPVPHEAPVEPGPEPDADVPEPEAPAGDPHARYRRPS